MTDSQKPLSQTTVRPDPEDEFYGGIWWVKAPDAFGLRSATPGECAIEIKRLRATLKQTGNLLIGGHPSEALGAIMSEFVDD